MLDATLDELASGIGLDRLRALHVNDARDGLGSNRDRHANVPDGVLGRKLATFLGNERLQGLPAVLETTGQRRPRPRRQRYPQATAAPPEGG